MLKAILWRSTLAILFCGSFHNAFASCDVDPLRPAIFPPIYDVYDKFRLAALQQNLSVAEATLSLGENDDPASIDQKRVSKVGLLTADSNYVADRLRAAILAAAERLNKKGIVRIVVDRDNLRTKVLDGAIEVRTPLSIVLLGDAAKIDLTLGFWTTVVPHEGGLKSQYLICDFSVHQISSLGRGPDRSGGKPLDASKSYQGELEQAKNDLFILLPETIIDIPAIPIEANAAKIGDFRIAFSEQRPKIALAGRAVLLSPKRVMVITLPGGAIPKPSRREVDLDEGYRRLGAIFTRAERLLTGIERFNENLAIVIARSAVSGVLEIAWRALDPKLTVSKRDKVDIPKTSIDLFPADAHCDNPCASVESCGNSNACTLNFCRTFSGEVCRNACPPEVPLDPVSRTIRQRCLDRCTDVFSCNEDGRRNCLNIFENCKSKAEACLTGWSSGQRVFCELRRMELIDPNFRGLAEISGPMTYSLVGETAGSELTVGGNLDSASLSVRLAAVAHLSPRLDIQYRDWGDFLLCINGPLGGDFQLTASTQVTGTKASIEWVGSSPRPTARISFGKIPIFVQSAEPPLVALIRQNPQLMQCGVTAPVAGLAIASFPRFGREALATAIRRNAKGESANVVAAIVDGGYTYEAELSPMSMNLPPFTVDVVGKPITLEPRLSALSLMWSSRRQK